MGYSVAREAACVGPGIGLAARVVLLAMSNIALDAPSNGRPPRVYWGGWKPLAIALGGALPPDTDRSAEATRLRRNLRARVEKAVRELRTAGLIVDVGAPAHAGWNQTYLITLHAPPQK